MASTSTNLEILPHAIKTFLGLFEPGISGKFECLHIGPLCNASKSFPFTEANCDLRHRSSDRNVLRGPGFKRLFYKGWDLLKRVTSESELRCSLQEEKALTRLRIFLQNIVANEECLLKAKGKIESTSAKEAIWTEALAEHLLSKLAPSGSYKIDHHRTGNGPYKQCRCGCGTAIKYGPTGIGHGAVWHGFVDIILSACPDNPDRDPVCTANVIPSENLDDESLESLTGGDQLSDDLQAKSEIKLNINSTENQTVAQTIVFALAQNQIHRNMRNLFIPNIVIDKESFIIIMYEAEKDILVWSVPFRLWACDKPCLQLSSVIALWMVLHYRQFCSGGDIFDEGNLEKIQAHFLKYADPRKLEIYKRHLEIGKTVFETQGESLEYLDKDFTIQDFDDSFYKV